MIGAQLKLRLRRERAEIRKDLFTITYSIPQLKNNHFHGEFNGL
jgi:hypothetical protein